MKNLNSSSSIKNLMIQQLIIFAKKNLFYISYLKKMRKVDYSIEKASFYLKLNDHFLII